MGLRQRKSTKNPPIFSHEFVIQNHADIVSCVAMVFVIGLMFQATAPVASLFVAMQHNVTYNVTTEYEGEEEDIEHVFYTYGMKDIFCIFFYTLICVVVHAVVQEYILDKLNRKMHLSKVKHSKFNESGQLLVFYLVSTAWGADIIFRNDFVTSISNLWEGYPHGILQFVIKFYFITQIAYWVHCIPELYFQKVKKEEMMSRITYAALYFVFITGAYLLNFTRVALCMMVLHYFVEAVFHSARLLYFADRTDLANTGFMAWNILFVLVRLGSITLAVLTFWYGLEQTGVHAVSIKDGNFNTQIVRINCLAAICLLQAWMMWNFITFHLKRMRERSTGSSAARKSGVGKKSKKVKGKKSEDEDSTTENDEGTVSENGSPAVRQRTPKVKRN